MRDDEEPDDDFDAEEAGEFHPVHDEDLAWRERAMLLVSMCVRSKRHRPRAGSYGNTWTP